MKGSVLRNMLRPLDPRTPSSCLPNRPQPDVGKARISEPLAATDSWTSADAAAVLSGACPQPGARPHAVGASEHMQALVIRRPRVVVLLWCFPELTAIPHFSTFGIARERHRQSVSAAHGPEEWCASLSKRPAPPLHATFTKAPPLSVSGHEPTRFDEPWLGARDESGTRACL
jgi:hypothetical protein